MDLQNSRISTDPQILAALILSSVKRALLKEDPLLAECLSGIKLTPRGTTILVSEPLALVKIRYYESLCRSEIDITLSRCTSGQTTGMLRFRL